MDKKQKNDKLRQHYVPKFYLRNFSENNKSIGLYRFKEKKIIKQGSIRDILQKNIIMERIHMLKISWRIMRENGVILFLI